MSLAADHVERLRAMAGAKASSCVGMPVHTLVSVTSRAMADAVGADTASLLSLWESLAHEAVDAALLRKHLRASSRGSTRYTLVRSSNTVDRAARLVLFQVLPSKPAAHPPNTKPHHCPPPIRMPAAALCCMSLLLAEAALHC